MMIRGPGINNWAYDIRRTAYGTRRPVGTEGEKFGRKRHSAFGRDGRTEGKNVGRGELRAG
jgi:hypothetical protein